MNRLTRVFLPLLVASGITAQQQWFVGAGGHAQIRDVMPLVAPGDTVVVAPGTYFQFTCTRGITIRAQTPGTVTVAFHAIALPQPCGCTCMSVNRAAVAFEVPVDQTAHVVGLAFAPFWSLTPCFSVFHQQVVVTGGRATFDDCAIDSLVVAAATVHLQDCTITSAKQGPGITATNANVTVVGGTIRGADAGVVLQSQPAGLAIASTNSRLHACGVAVHGGAASATMPGAPGVVANGGSLWLADANVTAGGGCAVAATGLVRIDRSTLSGGGAGCALSPTGAPLVGIDRAGPITIGHVFQVTLTSEPGALLLVYGATGLSAPIDVPGLVEQPIWIDPTALFLADLAIAPPVGSATFVYPVPAVPALAGAQFWLQGVGGTSFPLQTSPVVGGIVR